MRGQRTTSPVVRWVVSVAALVLVGYLAALALRPSIVDALPAWLAWFGRPGSMSTLGIVVTVLIVACVLTFRTMSRHGAAPERSSWLDRLETRGPGGYGEFASVR